MNSSQWTELHSIQINVVIVIICYNFNVNSGLWSDLLLWLVISMHSAGNPLKEHKLSSIAKLDIHTLCNYHIYFLYNIMLAQRWQLSMMNYSLGVLLWDVIIVNNVRVSFCSCKLTVGF